MRYTQIKPITEMRLDEINMGTKSLRKAVSKIPGALAGMEFEMIVPEMEPPEPDDWEPDFSWDQRAISIDNIIDFFSHDDYNDGDVLEQLRKELTNDLRDWASTQDTGGQQWTDEDMMDHNVQRTWLTDAGTRYMSDILTQVESDGRISLVWPYDKPVNGDQSPLMTIGLSFADYMGKKVHVYAGYHKRNYVGTAMPNGQIEYDRTAPDTDYRVEPDGSLNASSGEYGLEFVSPAQPINDMLEDVDKIISWAGLHRCYTGSDAQTGLHMNVSVPAMQQNMNAYSSYTSNIDYVKAALLLGDKRVLSEFNRTGNEFAQSALDIVKNNIIDNPDKVAEILERMKDGIGARALKAIHDGSTDKYTSINNKGGYIEYRGPGGDWLDEFHEIIEPTLLRFVVVTDAASDPTKFRKEYLTKLYKMMSPEKKKSSIDYFAKYVAGELPRTALGSFIRQLRSEREAEQAGSNMWEIFNIHSGRVLHKVEASNHDQAVAKALAWGRGAGLTDQNRHNYDIRRVAGTGSVGATEEPPVPTNSLAPRHSYEFYNQSNGQVLANLTNITSAEAMSTINRLEQENNLSPGSVLVRDISNRSAMAWEPDIGIAEDPTGGRFRLTHVPTNTVVRDFTARDDGRAFAIVNAWVERQTQRNPSFNGGDFSVEPVSTERQENPSTLPDGDTGDFEIYHVSTGHSIVKFYDVTEAEAMRKARTYYEQAVRTHPTFNVDNYSIRRFN